MIRRSITRRSGFTLVEIMVVLALFLLITIGVTAFVYDASRGMIWAVNKSRITNDVRIFTTRVVDEAFDANAIYVYTTFGRLDRDAAGDVRLGGQAGDCMVLVETAPYADVEDESGVESGTDADEYYRSIVVYFREPDNDGKGPVYRVEKVFSPAKKIVPGGFESELAVSFPSGTATATNAEIVLELARGRADLNLFRTSPVEGFVIINGEILYGNESERERDVTNTYNLTISSRG